MRPPGQSVARPAGQPTNQPTGGGFIELAPQPPRATSKKFASWVLIYGTFSPAANGDIHILQACFTANAVTSACNVITMMHGACNFFKKSPESLNRSDPSCSYARFSLASSVAAFARGKTPSRNLYVQRRQQRSNLLPAASSIKNSTAIPSILISSLLLINFQPKLICTLPLSFPRSNIFCNLPILHTTARCMLSADQLKHNRLSY